jgi:hypothetical protein
MSDRNEPQFISAADQCASGCVCGWCDYCPHGRTFGTECHPCRLCLECEREMIQQMNEWDATHAE